MKNSSFNNLYNSAPRVATDRKRQPTRKLCPNNSSCLGEEQFSLVLASFTFEEIWNLREQSLFMFIDWGMVSEGFFLCFFFFEGNGNYTFSLGDRWGINCCLQSLKGELWKLFSSPPLCLLPSPPLLPPCGFFRQVSYLYYIGRISKTCIQR